ncbi:hypothetical protein F2Q69_00029384 [Brassica cretica]|uniref:Uncharacterized protein n=1 Tax=Brassica cretica TaxID=69181 RepID=A0A8S9RYC6_BRACR|nr:hypothetical protein F2Q69_00029384 [Brassica cretica]
MQQRTVPAHQQRVTKEFYDTAGGIDNCFKQKYRHPTRPSIHIDVPPSIDRRPEFGRRAFDLFGTRKFYWEEKDEKLMERASRDEHSYICLPKHASSFTQTKDEINEMFYGVCGAQGKNEGDFQMKLDGVYYPLNDSITDRYRPASIDIHHSTSIDDDPKNSHSMKSQPDFHTRAEIDQLVEEIYRTLEITEERLDRRCDDIYFPMDLSMSALTSKIDAIQRELVEIKSYIAHQLEASASIDR